jgi:hypothetical protein
VSRLFRITNVFVILLLSSCAARLANTARDAQQPYTKTKRLPDTPLEERVMACLKQGEISSSGFKVARVVRLKRMSGCGLGLLTSIWTLGIWPNGLPADYIVELEGVANHKPQRRIYQLRLTEFYGTLLWLCPSGREDIKLAKSLLGAIENDTPLAEAK